MRYCDDQNLVKSSLKMPVCTYFGHEQNNVDTVDIAKQLHLDPLSIRQFSRMVKNLVIYTGCGHDNQKSRDYYAKITDGTFIRILKFLVHLPTNSEYCIYNRVVTTSSKWKLKSLHEISELESTMRIMKVDQIENVAFKISIPNSAFISELPHSLYY